jgi:hypothetical protein
MSIPLGHCALARPSQMNWTIPLDSQLNQGRRVPSLVGTRREGLPLGRGWTRVDSFRAAGEGTALSRYKWCAA